MLLCSNSYGRPFKIHGSATEKRQSPSEMTVRETVNMSMLEDRRERTGLCGGSILFKYGEVPCFTALKQSNAEVVLNSIHIRTRNQWREFSRSELGA